jgi:membrane protein required for beta-lactamase induction
MAREGTPDPVSDAFQRVSQDEPGREANVLPVAQRIDWVVVAFAVLMMALVGLGFLTLFEGWVFPG